MSIPPDIPNSVGEIVGLLKGVTNHTRPVSDEEAIQAINYGAGKVARAIRSVRPQPFTATADPFTITEGQSEIDLSPYTPTIWRPLRLFVPGSTSPVYTFRYRALTSPEFEAREGRGGSTVNVFYYEILHGQFAQTPLSARIVVQGSGRIEFSTNTQAEVAAAFPVGTPVMILGAGPAQPVGNSTSTINRTYYGIVTVLDDVNPVINVQPLWTAGAAFGTYAGIEHAVVPLRRIVMRLAPTPPLSLTGRLDYNYQPGQFRSLGELLDPVVVEYRDTILAYGIAWLLSAVNDAESQRWEDRANGLRAECIQEVDPNSGQNSEALESALPDD